MKELADMLEALAKEIDEKGPPEDPAIAMARLMDGATAVKVNGSLPKLTEGFATSVKQGSFVSVRPVGDKYGNRSFLGIYLGDMSTSAKLGRKAGSTVVEVSLGGGMGNPCIWVPDLNQLIYGMESWWGPIESEADLRQITNDDINNVWYVKAAKDLGFGEPNLQPDPVEH